MARKPVHLEMVGGKPPRQRIWEEIRRQRQEMTATGIARAIAAAAPVQERGAAAISRDTVRSYLEALRAGGYLTEDGRDPATGARLYLLAQDAGAEAPRLNRKGEPVVMGRGRELMWNTLRRLRQDMSAPELAALASTDDHRIAEGEAADYCATLARAGYLVVVHGTGPHRRYRFVPSKNTGPRAPMIQRLQSVYDPNLCQVVWQEAPHED